MNPWTRLVGPASRAESVAILVPAVIGGALVARSTARRRGLVRGAAAAAVAVDLIGGVVAFQTSSARSRYAESTASARMLFTAAHLQPAIMPLIGEGNWPTATRRYLLSLGGSALLTRMPAARRRVAGLAVTLAAVAIERIGATGTDRWLGPVYLTKLLAGHGTLADRPVSRS
ncbi:hypothetical protein [Nakamurella lactea]|uniref:hypothetical protein n=1 Tax=Nakamurella lactea TaxID=459515 RepID=UPI00041A4A5A|nr:hypothetical protein [Nakamurella lactea]